LLAETPNRELTYWLREGRSSNAELDFVIALEGNLIPIEVKSGATTGSLKSLHQFMGSIQATFAIRFDTSLPTVNQLNAVIHINKQRKPISYPLISLSLYLVEQLSEVVKSYLE